MKACGGQIWRCCIDTKAYGKEKARPVVVEKGELVEFRYWSPATFRTIDELYLSVEEKTFYDNFRYVGKIFEEVRFRNYNTTKQIIDCVLYSEEK